MYRLSRRRMQTQKAGKTMRAFRAVVPTAFRTKVN